MKLFHKITYNLFIPEPKFRKYTDSMLYMRTFGSPYSKIVIFINNKNK